MLNFHIYFMQYTPKYMSKIPSLLRRNKLKFSIYELDSLRQLLEIKIEVQIFILYFKILKHATAPSSKK